MVFCCLASTSVFGRRSDRRIGKKLVSFVCCGGFGVSVSGFGVGLGVGVGGSGLKPFC
jgi:hypothetical protein